MIDFPLLALLFLPFTKARIWRRNQPLLRHPKLQWGGYNGNEEGLENEYIIVLDDSVSDVEATIRSLTDDPDLSFEHIYTSVFKGAAISGVQRDSVLSILDDSSVKYASPNEKIDLFETQQSDPGWNLDRIDQENYPLDDTYNYNFDGSGVTVFIIDSGIRETHDEFQGRASCGFTADKSNPDNCQDLIGHGTHVAATVAGQKSGVAKNATLVAVKVIRDFGRGTVSDVIAGIDYVTMQKKNQPDSPMVANMSLGSPRLSVVNDAANAAVDAGVVFVAAAGNASINSCLMSPGSARNTINVGATNNGDRRAWYSNYGRCVDIFAPGGDIVSAGIGSDDDFDTRSGTSYACPHVAGAAALYLSKDPKMTPAAVWNEMKSNALEGQISWFLSRRSPNLLLNVENI